MNQCFVIDKDLSKATDDILPCNSYLPPRTSSCSYIDELNEIERALTRGRYTDKITLLCGDFNSHTNIVLILLILNTLIK